MVATRRPLGLLRPREDADVAMMLCTAGHVDHGKTKLVGLLTGCRTDRLKVEQERGLTIELGYAPCSFGEEFSVGVVDVPGHEKFIRNMVAGVSGISMTVLVIAADDGVMPQTVEHLEIMELLGVRRGVVALTKTDLVDAEFATLRVEEIRDFLQGTFLEGAPVCPVSSETFEGYPEFYETLMREAREVAAQDRGGVFRMPVQRVFASAGHGVVATGIPVDGAVRIGDEVELLPGGRRGRVRSIQRFGRNAEQGGCGQCLALNIPDFVKTPPERGQVLASPGFLRAERCFHVSLKTVRSLSKPLQNAENVLFHVGTSESSGKLYLLEDEAVEAGRETLATVVLPEPVAAAVHDRCIVRRPSPSATAAGGEILGLWSGEKRPPRGAVLDAVKPYRDALKGVDARGPEGRDVRVRHFLRHVESRGASVEAVARGVQLPPASVAESLARLAATGEVKAFGGGFHLDAQRAEEMFETLRRRIRDAEKAGDFNLTAGSVRAALGWPTPVWNAAVAAVETEGLVRKRGDQLVVRGAVEAMSAEDRALAERMTTLYRETGFDSPRPDELPERLGAPAKRCEAILRVLVNEKTLMRVAKSVVLHYDAFRSAEEWAVRKVQEAGTVSVADFKDAFGCSRKYAVAFLDYLDGLHVTARVGNDRRLTPNYEANML